MIVATSSSNGIAARISKILKVDMIRLEEKIFPDGEIYVRVPAKVNGDAVVVCSLNPPQERNFLLLSLSIEALVGAGAENVIAVVPYMSYARQDKRFLDGEAISIKVILKTIESVGASALLAVDVHSQSSLDEWLTIPHANILPSRAVAEFFRDRLRNPLVLAPDAGALWRARSVAELMGAPYDYIEKRRDRVTGEVIALPKDMDVEGRDVLIVDDIISTGGTLALAARSVKERGARGVYAACTHALLVRGALDRVISSGVDEVVATDTVPSPISKITVAPLIAEELAKLL